MIRINCPIFTVSFAPYGNVYVKPCTKILFEDILNALNGKNSREIYRCTESVIGKNNMPCRMPLSVSCRAFLQRYLRALDDYCEKNMDYLKMPERLEFGEEEKPKLKMPISTYEESMVHDYTGLSFSEIGELDILNYRFYLIEAYKVSILKRADGTGTEYLNECYNYMHQIDDDFDI